MFLLKFTSFCIYSLIVIIFAYYLNIIHLFNVYKDWIFCDFKNETIFDFIVVGAGSAGSVVASRLSNAGAKTLLIEAGGSPGYFFNIPVLASLLMNSQYDWQYLTVPQEHACKGLINNQSAWTAGKILGGSSRLNYMVYVKGHPKDYDSWFNDYKDPIIEKGGSLHIEEQKWFSEVSDALLQGINEMSHPLRDINTSPDAGFMRTYLTTKNGERFSTDRLINRNNKKLKVLTNALVTKILFKVNKAVGINFYMHNQMYTAFAKSGVIVSAGAVGTPKLLMLSGIGPKDHLEKLNINTIADLPVGQNLRDHVLTGLDLITLNTSTTITIPEILNPFSMIKYYLHGKGAWTCGAVDIVGTFYSNYQNKSSAPDLQIMTFPTGVSQDNGMLMRKNFKIRDETFNKYFAPLTYKSVISITPTLLHPKSKGEVRLKTINPFDAPIIDPNYLSNEEDVLTLIEGIKFIKDLINTKAMKKIDAQLYKMPFPGCEKFVFDTIEYWKCYIRHLTLTVYHPSGTCRMGDVVDSKFRVYNTQNLYVVDASVFPKLPSGNTNAPVIMLSEKASRLLIQHFERNLKNSKKCYIHDIFFILR